MASSPPVNLILITNHFPYGTGEAFLESEVPHLVRSFDKVIVLTRNVHTSGPPVAGPGFSHERIDPKSNPVEIITTVGLSVLHFKTVLSFLGSEIHYLKSREGKVSLKKLGIVFHDLFKALALSISINRLIRTNRLTGTIVVYSYWLTSSALATLFVKPKHATVKRISRAHRADVYESIQTHGYLSFREVLAEGLDGIFAVSDDGFHHLKNKIDAKWHNRLHLARLGTRKPESFPKGNPPTGGRSGRQVIVSCSFLTPVKRIHLIIEALALIESLDIQWIHFGDGPLRAELENRASQKLSSRTTIRAEFKGLVANKDLLQFYNSNRVDLFINTSSSEGIPVSMMEAQSFGIPILAMDVGGVREIVGPQTGRLLRHDDPPLHIAKAITELLTLPEEQKDQIRKNVFDNWNLNFNADKNFSIFITAIRNL